MPDNRPLESPWLFWRRTVHPWDGGIALLHLALVRDILASLNFPTEWMFSPTISERQAWQRSSTITSAPDESDIILFNSVRIWCETSCLDVCKCSCQVVHFDMLFDFDTLLISNLAAAEWFVVSSIIP